MRLQESNKIEEYNKKKYYKRMEKKKKSYRLKNEL